MRIYPNPVKDKSRLLITAPRAGNATITIFDIAGRQLSKLDCYVDNCLQEFSLSGLNNGTYIVNVQGNNYQFSERLISTGKFNGTISIEKLSTKIQSTNIKKSGNDFNGTKGVVEMEYTNGDWLKLTGISDNYNTVITEVVTASKTLTFNFIACTDGSSNNYPIVKIGDQWWMAEDLKTKKYSNGDPIATTTPETLDISGEDKPEYQWSYEDDDITYGTTLFTAYVILDNRNVCPEGWHVPTDAEWTSLITSLGGEGPAMFKMKETWESHWMPGTSFQTATNESGFTALPTGYRSDQGQFMGMRYTGAWWSATEFNATAMWYRSIDFLTDYVIRDYMAYVKKDGLGVRCVMDNAQ
ncbi:MAG: T9SS type A sorting domain-containing protein [Bacteroidales bacterium]|nr:T9SS type A sorting domain-containing protein [Bacteroidales bacterium]